MFCTHCGSKIEDGVNYCPVCGTPQHSASSSSPYGPGVFVSPDKTPKPRGRYSALSIVGFAFSVVSLFLNLFALIGVVGMVVSIFGLRDCKRKNRKGRALALAGIFIGAASTVFTVLLLLAAA